MERNWKFIEIGMNIVLYLKISIVLSIDLIVCLNWFIWVINFLYFLIRNYNKQHMFIFIFLLLISKINDGLSINVYLLFYLILLLWWANWLFPLHLLNIFLNRLIFILFFFINILYRRFKGKLTISLVLYLWNIFLISFLINHFWYYLL